MRIVCKGCGKEPHEIESVRYFADGEGVTPEEFVIDNEGTYNEKTGLFYCDDCYIAEGMPLGKA